jgi:PhzF family phenazine biosynthesis protein
MKSFIVDAFTKEAFKGNPAAVCFPEQEMSEETMLNIAKEFALSETAFVRKTDRKDTFTIRYFSPKKEIPLCGHATLASAKIIFKTTAISELHFITVEKIDLLIKQIGEEIIMAFPLFDTIERTVAASMLDALGLKEVKNTAYSPKNKIILLEINDAWLLANLSPDFNALVGTQDGINGVLVTAESNTVGYDYHYRYFWPWSGTNEDPVTGGVQTFLAKYWSERLNKKIMRAYQSSERTGYMQVEVKTDKVLITGEAVIVFEGNLI